MANALEILRLGLFDGLVWFPFVLGIGLLYKHLKIIDVSIDGTAVISGIACAWIWTDVKLLHSFDNSVDSFKYRILLHCLVLDYQTKD